MERFIKSLSIENPLKFLELIFIGVTLQVHEKVILTLGHIRLFHTVSYIKIVSKYTEY